MINGILLLDKPKNISSNKALYIVKRKLSPKKAGIVGILDPLASGMILACKKNLENKHKQAGLGRPIMKKRLHRCR